MKTAAIGTLPFGRWVGELFVIALGIAMGFQVDRWYEARQDDAKATEYVERIRASLREDLESFGGQADSATSRLQSLERVIVSLESDEVVLEDPTRYMYDLRRANMRFLAQPNSAVYEELISTGNMALLPLNVREPLHRYYTSIEQFSQFRGSYQEMQMEAYRRFAGILPADHFGVLSGVFPDSSLSFTANEALEAAQRLRRNPGARDWLYQAGELKAEEIKLAQVWSTRANELLKLTLPLNLVHSGCGGFQVSSLSVCRFVG